MTESLEPISDAGTDRLLARMLATPHYGPWVASAVRALRSVWLNACERSGEAWTGAGRDEAMRIMDEYRILAGAVWDKAARYFPDEDELDIMAALKGPVEARILPTAPTDASPMAALEAANWDSSGMQNKPPLTTPNDASASEPTPPHQPR